MKCEDYADHELSDVSLSKPDYDDDAFAQSDAESQLIEGIWEWMSEERYDRSFLQTTNRLTPNAFHCLTEQRKEGFSYAVATSGVGIATVSVPNGNQFEVDLSLKLCSCGLFVDNMFPCKHALKVMDVQSLNVLDYIHPKEGRKQNEVQLETIDKQTGNERETCDCPLR
jgi:hypothetical protein